MKDEIHNCTGFGSVHEGSQEWQCWCWTAFRSSGAKGLAEKKQVSTPFTSQTTIRLFPLQVDCLGTHASRTADAQVVRCWSATVESWSVHILIEVAPHF